MANIVIILSDAASTLAEQAAVKYGYANAAAWAREWLKNSLVNYKQQQQQQTADAQVKIDAANVELMFK